MVSIQSRGSERSVNLLISKLNERPLSPNVMLTTPSAEIKSVSKEAPPKVAKLPLNELPTTNAGTNIMASPVSSYRSNFKSNNTPVEDKFEKYIEQNPQLHLKDQKQKLIKGLSFRNHTFKFRNQSQTPGLNNS